MSNDLLPNGTEVGVFDLDGDIKIGTIVGLDKRSFQSAFEWVYSIQHSGCVPYLVARKRSEFELMDFLNGYDDFQEKIRDRLENV